MGPVGASRRHRRPIAEPMPSPPTGRYHSMVPRFANFVSRREHWERAEFNSVGANFDTVRLMCAYLAAKFLMPQLHTQPANVGRSFWRISQ
jgi:hypothetical protein